MKIALAQINPLIGDVPGNSARIAQAIRHAADAGAELVVFPEQAVLGYPAKDLLLRRELIARNVDALQAIAAAMPTGAAHGEPIAALLGYAEPNEQSTGRPVFNTAALLSSGGIVARWRKRLLPTYDVFDEARYFEPAGPQPVLDFRGARLAVTICEDVLSEPMFGRAMYTADPVADAAAQRPDFMVNLSASPYWLDKQQWRINRLAIHARKHGLPILYVNQVGGNDELLFDGASCMIDAGGNVVAQARSFEEDLLLVDVEPREAPRTSAFRVEHTPTGPAALHEALVMGLRDYVRKCGFRTVVLGVSGGVDSAVVAALAVAALGPDHVHAVAMPSRFSSAHSLSDARTLAENLGVRLSVLPIEEPHAAYERVLAAEFAGRPPDVTEENIQARVRGALLMALSNKFGHLLLSTGNKSELAVGYCTLYGDMCGGLALISDVPKTLVYGLARYVNQRAGRGLIPLSTLDKPPSAELRPNQTDQDCLPPYDVLDAILERYETQSQTPEEIIAAGFDEAVVRRVIGLIHGSEYKRQQAAPGIKVTTRAFGFGRRMPIAARV